MFGFGFFKKKEKKESFYTTDSVGRLKIDPVKLQKSFEESRKKQQKELREKQDKINGLFKKAREADKKAKEERSEYISSLLKKAERKRKRANSSRYNFNIETGEKYKVESKVISGILTSGETEAIAVLKEGLQLAKSSGELEQFQKTLIEELDLVDLNTNTGLIVSAKEKISIAVLRTSLDTNYPSELINSNNRDSYITFITMLLNSDKLEELNSNQYRNLMFLADIYGLNSSEVIF